MDLVAMGRGDAIKWLLTKLGALLAEDYTLIRCVRGDIQYITDELASMQAFIGDLSSTAPHDHDLRMRDWLKQIRELTYDVEDCVDDFAHRVSDDPTSDLYCCLFLASKIYEVYTWWPRHEIATTLSELKMRAQHIGERRIRYGLDNPKSSQGRPGGAAIGFNVAEYQQKRLTLIITKTPVGVEEEIKVLEKWISLTIEETMVTGTQQLPCSSTRVTVEEPDADPTNQNRHCHGVLCIVGLAGVGKTTIATSLYQNFSHQFDHRAMVTVSQNSDVEAILRSILMQIMPQPREGTKRQSWWETSHGSIRGGTVKKTQGSIQTMKLEKLKKELKEQFEKYSYVLLLDDVWSTDTWEQVNKSLPKSEKGSRVIITSRFQAVASACVRHQGDYLHKAATLSVAKSKELFEKIMAEAEVRKEQQDQSKVISGYQEMCMGLPLAIVTMAGYAACNPQISDWKQVCGKLVPDHLRSHDGLMKIIDHCYYDMPSEIKTCSLYLSIFPSGCQNSRKRLIRKWISEGLVIEKQGLSEEEVADIYFNHLIRRQIIRAVKHNSNGEVKTYEVHHMVLEYLVCKASEENFVTVVGGHWLMAPPSSKVRRLSLQSHGLKHGSMNLSHVRSLSVFASLNGLLSKPNKLSSVQHLDLEGCKDFKQQHTKDVCELFLLKHISLRRTDVTKLPKEIGKLQYLETLDIRETGITKLPRSICQLEKMRNILGGNKKTRKALKLPEDMKKKPMKSLRVLSGIEIIEGPTSVASFHHLTKLRKLVIYKLNIKNGGKLFDELSSSIEDLGGYSLQTLVIDAGSCDFLSSWGAHSSAPKFLNALELSCELQMQVVNLPSWITELEALTKLTLSVGMLSGDALVHLSQLKNLFSLTFSLADAEEGLELKTIRQQIRVHLQQGSPIELEPIMISVQPGGFENLKLLRFSAPYVPELEFLDKAMPNLERLDLRFFAFEAVHGIEKLELLKELHFRVHTNASQYTQQMVQHISNELREHEIGIKVMVDQYH